MIPSIGSSRHMIIYDLGGNSEPRQSPLMRMNRIMVGRYKI